MRKRSWSSRRMSDGNGCGRDPGPGAGRVGDSVAPLSARNPVLRGTGGSPVAPGARRSSEDPVAERRGKPVAALTKLRPLVLLLCVVLAVTALYLGRGILVPVALAVLLTFLVHPAVGFLARLGLGRVPSVIAVVVALFSILGAVAFALVLQLESLSDSIPEYRDNLIAKIAVVRGFGRGGVLERVKKAATEVSKALEKEALSSPPVEKPTPVIVRSESRGLWQVPSLFEGFGTAAIVVVLVIFMLLEREDLRNRFLRLSGHKRLASTTRALDEAGQRISRYLQMQTLINASLGAGVSIGLMLIGVPYALLLGFLAAVLRFIPYVGPWLAGGGLVLFCLAAFPEWWPSLLVLGLFVALEIAAAVVLEPVLFGQSAGISQLSLLLSVAFWTWLWGPIGLLLATPVTVCLVVLAKNAPELEFVAVLMADEPPLAPPMTYYQRLVAGDQDEASEIVEEYLKGHSLQAVYDDVILPALGQARQDRQLDRVTEGDQRFIWEATREIVDDVSRGNLAAPAGSEAVVDDGRAEDLPPALRTVHLMAYPVHDEADELALAMLQRLLDPARWRVDAASSHLLAGE